MTKRIIVTLSFIGLIAIQIYGAYSISSAISQAEENVRLENELLIKEMEHISKQIQEADDDLETCQEETLACTSGCGVMLFDVEEEIDGE